MSNSTPYSDDTSRKVIDVAAGILVGVRCCSPREAFPAWGELAGRGRLVPVAH